MVEYAIVAFQIMQLIVTWAGFEMLNQHMIELHAGRVINVK